MRSIFSFHNFLSFCRFPLAFVFLSDDITLRATAIVLAILTDTLDGYIARRCNDTSQFGAMLDPLADKFFVMFALFFLYKESLLTYREIMAMLCRDFSVTIFGFYLWYKGQLGKYQFRSIWCGKATTTLQFLVLLALLFQVQLPTYLFASFIALGIAALVELVIKGNSIPAAASPKS